MSAEVQAKKIILFTICLAIVIICYGETKRVQRIIPSQEKKKTSLYIENSKFDFGNLIQGEVSAATTTYQNTGNDILTIERITSEIQGISSVVSKMSLQPGENGTIEVMLDSTFLFGPIHANILIFTNHGEEPAGILEVKANINAVLAFQPASIFTGQIAKDASYSGRTMLIGKLVTEGKIKDFEIKTSSPAMETKIQEPTKNTTGIIFEFVLQPEFKAGTFKETIMLISEDINAQAQLVIMGQKLGIIRVTPDRFEFFPRNGKMPKKLEIIFECEKIFKIT